MEDWGLFVVWPACWCWWPCFWCCAPSPSSRDLGAKGEHTDGASMDGQAKCQTEKKKEMNRDRDCFRPGWRDDEDGGHEDGGEKYDEKVGEKCFYEGTWWSPGVTAALSERAPTWLMMNTFGILQCNEEGDTADEAEQAGEKVAFVPRICVVAKKKMNQKKGRAEQQLQQQQQQRQAREDALLAQQEDAAAKVVSLKAENEKLRSQLQARPAAVTEQPAVEGAQGDRDLAPPPSPRASHSPQSEEGAQSDELDQTEMSAAQLAKVHEKVCYERLSEAKAVVAELRQACEVATRAAMRAGEEEKEGLSRQGEG